MRNLNICEAQIFTLCRDGLKVSNSREKDRRNLSTFPRLKFLNLVDSGGDFVCVSNVTHTGRWSEKLGVNMNPRALQDEKLHQMWSIHEVSDRLPGQIYAGSFIKF